MQNWPPRSPLWTPGSLNSRVNLPAPWAKKKLSREMAAQLLDEWFGSARLAQYPVGATLRDIWLVLGGRGAGKTRLGAEWVHALVGGLSPFATYRYGRIALVGETLNDVREVRPLQIMTTTPRPVPLIRKLLRSERVTVTR